MLTTAHWLIPTCLTATSLLYRVRCGVGGIMTASLPSRVKMASRYLHIAKHHGLLFKWGSAAAVVSDAVMQCLQTGETSAVAYKQKRTSRNALAYDNNSKLVFV